MDFSEFLMLTDLKCWSLFRCIPFNFLSSSSRSSLRHFFWIYLSLSLSTAASITSPPSVPSSVFLPRHPSRLLVLFSFALSSRFYLSFFCLASPQGLTSPLSLFSTSPSIISSLCLYFLQRFHTSPLLSPLLVIFTFVCPTFGGKMWSLLKAPSPCPLFIFIFLLLSQAHRLYLEEEGWRAPPTGQNWRCLLALRDAQQIR